MEESGIMCWTRKRQYFLKELSFYLIAALLLSFAISACDGSNGGGDSDSPGPLSLEPTNFDVIFERQLTEEESGGALSPEVTAKTDSRGNAHIYFYTSGESLDTTDLLDGSDLAANPFRFLLHHIVLNTNTGQQVGEEEIVDTTTPYTADSPEEQLDMGIDNNHLIGVAFLQGTSPVVVYQGGARPQSAGGLSCNSYYQGDLMVAVKTGGVWQDYIGIQGDASIKNQLFIDGLVGVHGDVVVDAGGVIHMLSQHYYESCDLHGTMFPDILYVQQSMADLGNFSVDMEEYVDEHNTYGTGGGIENAVGYYCKLVLDPDGQPVAFYYGRMANGDRVIRASRRVDGEWQAETVALIDDADYTVGDLGAAIADDGTMYVAYFQELVTENDDFDTMDHLRCARKLPNEEKWEIAMVDYSSYCGNYCRLVLDNSGRPAIVYYDERPYTTYREHHWVKLARFTGDVWNLNIDWRKEYVDRDGQVGVNNSLWFNGQNAALVCTYDQENRKIKVLREITVAAP